MSNLTDLLPAGAGGKQVSFVASGTLSSGQTVALNSDGTVSAVAIQPQGVGTEVSFVANSTYGGGTAYDSNSGKIVIVYNDSGDSFKGKAIVGTVSGTSISFGTPVVYNSNINNTGDTTVVFDSGSNKVVIGYQDAGNSNYGTAIVGTVSGTSISFGTAVVYASVGVYSIGLGFDSSSNKVVVADSRGQANVGTVSGTSISFGSAVTYETGAAFTNSVVFDSSNNKIVIAFQDDNASGAGTAIVGTVSGTSISFGTQVQFTTENSVSVTASFNSISNKVLIAWTNYPAYSGKAIVGTVSGTSISFGTASSGLGSVNIITSVYDSSANKHVLIFRDKTSPNYGKAVPAVISGTSVAFGTTTTFTNYAINYPLSAAYDSTQNKVVMNYRNIPSDAQAAMIFSNESSNNTDFIGISDAAISDTASGSVTIKGGISTNVTGLTPNSTYYVQADGSLSTTVSSVLAGKALSSTSINLDYTT